MRPSKVHCLFEQSGTYKNEFKKMGIPAEDYDIENRFEETDNVIDLFNEIREAMRGGRTIFDRITSNDLIIAFFPCIRFEDQAILWFRGDNFAQIEWDDIRKLEYAIKCQRELTDLYELISYLTIICIRKNVPLIIENPYSTQHYLTQRWCIKPKVIDTDRRERGDVYKKPTQYWFINCEPSNNFIWEPQIMWDEYLSVHKDAHGIKRSLMTTEYANRFIREFILDASDET